MYVLRDFNTVCDLQAPIAKVLKYAVHINIPVLGRFEVDDFYMAMVGKKAQIT